MKRTVRGAIVTRSVEPKRQDDGTCIADTDSEALLNGVIDLEANRSGYVASLVVQNQLRVAADPAKARVETGGIYLLGASVRLTYVNGTPLVSSRAGVIGNEFRTAGSGYIEPTGVATITVNMVDGAAIETLKQALGTGVAGGIRPEVVIAYVRVQAQTLGGLAAESQEFQFPITICSRCLIDFPAQPIAGDICPPSEKPEEDAKTSPCTIGQNRRVSCRLCKGFSKYCGCQDSTCQ
jgi:hypothetical protein